MNPNTVLPWIRQTPRRNDAIRQLSQPLTISQLARRLDVARDTCSRQMRALASRSLVQCLNPGAGRSRVYWLTPLGEECRHALVGESSFPTTDWALYGWACFSHRSAIIKALDEPLQPAAIKRRARQQNPELTMSANNVRDVIRLFLENGIVTKTERRGAAHPRFQLTPTGRTIRTLLFNAETTIL